MCRKIGTYPNPSVAVTVSYSKPIYAYTHIKTTSSAFLFPQTFFAGLTTVVDWIYSSIVRDTGLWCSLAQCSRTAAVCNLLPRRMVPRSCDFSLLYLRVTTLSKTRSSSVTVPFDNIWIRHYRTFSLLVCFISIISQLRLMFIITNQIFYGFCNSTCYIDWENSRIISRDHRIIKNDYTSVVQKPFKCI